MNFLLAAAAGHPAIDVTPWMILPFALLLALIAVGPLFFAKWWHHHYPKVAVGLGAITVAYYTLVLHLPERLLHVGHEYISFIMLIGSLFVVAGGIHITVKGESKPWINVVFLSLGAVIANVIGTTGASMLLIRPWVRMNKYRITTFHVVFFIFIVSNVGGALTPIGDPPLFLGFLKGVPFFWILEHAWPVWLLAMALLLLTFYVLDRINFAKPPSAVTEEMTASETWRFEGLGNMLFVAVIIAAVLFNKNLPIFVPEAIMLAAALASLLTTPKQIHTANHFNFDPIREVAWLFVGIFATMIPALDYLGAHAENFGIDTPGEFFWLTGTLSAVLDNAPTYLTFLSTQMGIHHLDIDSVRDVLADANDFPLEVLAISMGAVFFGAMTYIGNGPNLMVRSICDNLGVKTPSFFGYLLCWSIPFLLPVLIIVWITFFSPWQFLP